MNYAYNNTKKIFILVFTIIISFIVIVSIFKSSIFGSTNKVSYNVQSDWGAGATVNVTIENTSSEKIDGWTLKWIFPGNQKITSLWNGNYKQNGTTVIVKNKDWNKVISPNESLRFGFTLTYSNKNFQPTDFSLIENNDNITKKLSSEITPSNTNFSTTTPIPETTNSLENSIYDVDGYDRKTTFDSIFKISSDKFFYENGEGKIIDGLHYGTGTQTGSSQFGGHFFGDIILPDEIKDNVVAVNKYDLFTDESYSIPILAGAVLEIQHVFLDKSGNISSPIGTTQDKAYVIVTDSMFDGGRLKGDIDIFTTTYNKIKGSTLGGGCLFTNWKVVEFSNLSKNLNLSYIWKEANNPYYLAFKLLWHRLPIKSINFNGSELERTQDNVFKLPNHAVSVSGSAEIDINYIDNTSETVTIGGPKDTKIHTATLK
ncbi:MAG: cellulose binding domain-containing protein [Clostridiales bacterium]